MKPLNTITNNTMHSTAQASSYSILLSECRRDARSAFRTTHLAESLKLQPSICSSPVPARTAPLAGINEDQTNFIWATGNGVRFCYGRFCCGSRGSEKNLMRAPIVSLLYLSRWNTVWFGGLYVSYYGKLVTKQRVMGCMHVCPCY